MSVLKEKEFIAGNLFLAETANVLSYSAKFGFIRLLGYELLEHITFHIK